MTCDNSPKTSFLAWELAATRVAMNNNTIAKADREVSARAIRSIWLIGSGITCYSGNPAEPTTSYRSTAFTDEDGSLNRVGNLVWKIAEQTRRQMVSHPFRSPSECEMKAIRQNREVAIA